MTYFDDTIPAGERLRLRMSLREKLDHGRKSPSHAVWRPPQAAHRSAGGVEYKSRAGLSGIHAWKLRDDLFAAERGGRQARGASFDDAIRGLLEIGG